MGLEEDLATWLGSRPAWQQSAVRKICRSESFDKAAIVAIAYQLTVRDTDEASSFTAADIPGSSAENSVALIALKDVTGVNALAPDQALTFGRTGVTIVYGHNASGKSGYARLLKSVVGARVLDDVLGNVFAADGAKSQRAAVQYITGTDSQIEDWTWPASPNPALQQVRFYDEACGNAYLSTSSEITYRPSALVLLNQLIALCDAVRAVFEERLHDSDASKPTLPTVPDGTVASSFLAGLKATTTSAAIEAQCQAPADADAILSTLLAEEVRLKASDPAKEQNRLRGLADALEVIACYCDRVAESLSPLGIENLTKARTNAVELRAAAVVASSQSFDAEPIPGVGTRTWRGLWEAARAYSEAEVYHHHSFPATDLGSRCVLCQQELSEGAAQRLLGFRAFMSDATEREAAKAEQELVSTRQALEVLSKPSREVMAAAAKVRTADALVADELDKWMAKAVSLCESVAAWLGGAEENEVRSIEASLGAMLAGRAIQLRDEATMIDAASFAESLRAASRRVAELRGTIALSEHRSVIEQELARLQERARIAKAKRLTDTGPITRKSSELTRNYVTRVVRDHFTRESERFRLSRITLDDTGGVKGQLQHRPALLGAVDPVAVTKVLSEGEQTVLGLSGFFTEVSFDDTKSAVVLDDPVTSLDHERRSLVARRLVQLAADRQVIVFTHEVTFVGDLVRYAKESHISCTPRSIERGASATGIVKNKLPWNAKDVESRIGELRNELARIRRERINWDQETYERECGDWAGRLSMTWERAVNLDIVYRVVDRGTSHVQPKQVRILASFTGQDNDEFQAGYGRCSEWARRHDKDPEVNFVDPEPDDLQAELDRLSQWHDRVKRYRE